MGLWRRRGRPEIAVQRAVQRVDDALAAGPSGARRLAEAYRAAVRTAIDADPGRCLSLVRRVDARIPAELYPVAFSGADAQWLGRHAASDDTAVLTVVFEVATRVGVVEVSRAARDRLADRMGASCDSGELAGRLSHWIALGVVDREVLTRVLRMHAERTPLVEQEAVWTAFLEQLPAQLLPDLFDVQEVLGRAGPAARLADTPERVRRALALCGSASSSPEEVEAGLALARRAGDPVAVRGLLGRAGELAMAAGRLQEALEFFSEAGNAARRSECFERLGRPFEALEGCPVERLPVVAQECLRRVDALMAGDDVFEAVRGCRLVLGALDASAGGVPGRDAAAVVECRGEAFAALQAVLGVARRRFQDLVTAGGEDAGAALAAWSRLEEQAGEPVAAAELAEQGGDLYRAHRLYYRAGRFGEAERVLRVDGSPAGLSARAEARAAGGDLRGAGRLRESVGDWDAAVDLFARAGDHSAAVDCLLRHRGPAALTDSRLAGLRGAAHADRIAELCLQVLDGRRDDPSDAGGAATKAGPTGKVDPAAVGHGLPGAGPAGVGREEVERAPALREAAVTMLRSLVAGPELSAVRRAVADEVLAGLDGPRRAAFEARAQALVARARADVDERFAGVWGFDLGTTTCAAAIYDGRVRRAVLCPWKGQAFFPSTLSVDERGNEIVGLTATEALAGWVVGQVSGSKRRLGGRTVYRIRDRDYRPEEVAARLVRHGRALVEGFLTDRVRERLAELVRDEVGDVPAAWLEWVERHHELRLDRPRALLTVPAYVLNNAKQATRDACEIAGVEVVRLIHEPTAACVSASRERGLSGRVVVVDLGAGTLDLSVLEVGEGVYHVQQVLGDNRFGGSDLDAVVTDELLADLARRGYRLPERGVARRRVAAAAEYLKIALSGQDRAEHTLVGLTGGEDVTLGLTRHRLAQLLAQPLERLVQVCTRMRQSMGDPAEHLVLVGGPMLAPMIREVVEKAFDLRRTPLPDPRTAVACGAALQAAVLDRRLDEVVLVDVTPLPLGVHVLGDDGASELSVVIEANTTIPAEGHRRYTTVRDLQPTVSIEVFNGELDPAARIATFDLEGIVPAPAGEPEIDVRFAIDANCVLEVTAKDLGTGRARSVRLADSTLLSPGEVADLARRQRERTETERVWRRLGEAVAEAEGIDVQAVVSEFTDRLAGHRPGRGSLPPQTERELVTMHREHARVEAELAVLRDPLRDLLTAARRVLDGGDAPAASYVLERLEATLSRARPPLDLLDRWIAVLVAVAVADPDPLQQFRARHAAGHHARALEAMPELPADAGAADVERYLHCLAETADAERYLSVLGAHAAALTGLTRVGADRAGYPTALAAAVGTVHGPGTSNPRGAAVLVAEGIALTTRRTLTGSDRVRGPIPGSAADAPTLLLEGIPHRLTRSLLPEADVVDLAVAVLAGGPVGIRPLRLGYGGLVRVGDRVQALLPPAAPAAAGPAAAGPAAAAPGAAPATAPLAAVDVPQLVDGTVEHFELFPELGLHLMRLSLPVPGPAGTPVVNAAGELVGLLTGSRTDGTFAIITDPARSLLDQGQRSG